jgi:hypothetical protein
VRALGRIYAQFHCHLLISPFSIPAIITLFSTVYEPV